MKYIIQVGIMLPFDGLIPHVKAVQYVYQGLTKEEDRTNAEEFFKVDPSP